MIFTSPSSARGNLDEEEAPASARTRKKAPPRRPPVAVQLRMDGRVTARAIAYAAVQVCSSLCPTSWLTSHCKLHFALNDATHWNSHYNGFNYEEFYEFIIDFFEDDTSPEGKGAASELFDWWNRYVKIFHRLPMTKITSAVYFRGLPPQGQPPLDQQGGHRSRSYENSARHVSAPSFGLFKVVSMYTPVYLKPILSSL